MQVGHEGEFAADRPTPDGKFCCSRETGFPLTLKLPPITNHHNNSQLVNAQTAGRRYRTARPAAQP
jgi:hypothetical protein